MSTLNIIKLTVKTRSLKKCRLLITEHTHYIELFLYNKLLLQD